MSIKNINYHMEAAVGTAAGSLAGLLVGIAAVAGINLALKGARRLVDLALRRQEKKFEM
mgnify:CR=1 FL=1